jgi:hypothetical protein
MPVSYFDWLDKAISEVLKPLKMVLGSSREIESFKFQKIHAGPPVYYTGSNETSHAPKFEWPDHTFKTLKLSAQVSMSRRLSALKSKYTVPQTYDTLYDIRNTPCKGVQLRCSLVTPLYGNR